MDEPANSDDPVLTGSDMTRRELLEMAVVTGRALVGGQLVPGFISQVAAQTAGVAPAPLNLMLRVNGTEHQLTLDPHHAARRAAGTLATHGLEEGLWPRPVRRLHGAD